MSSSPTSRGLEDSPGADALLRWRGRTTAPWPPTRGASGPLCIAASLQLGAALAEFLVFEHMFLDNPLREIVTPRLPEPSNGVIDVPVRPGLGFELDEAAVERFRRS